MQFDTLIGSGIGGRVKNDSLKSGSGYDTLIGGTGKDAMDGESGNDTFIVRGDVDRGEGLTSCTNSAMLSMPSRQLPATCWPDAAHG